MKHWKNALEEILPLLGHRNWIVVTDMAYPLQTNPGIDTYYAAEPYAEVVGTVADMLGSLPNVTPHIYQDTEQLAMSEALCAGWNAYRDSLAAYMDMKEVVYVPHEDLIHRLDEVSNLYKVVIIKTSLTIPYTSTFFELDCGYWDAHREQILRSGK